MLLSGTLVPGTLLKLVRTVATTREVVVGNRLLLVVPTSSNTLFTGPGISYLKRDWNGIPLVPWYLVPNYYYCTRTTVLVPGRLLSDLSNLTTSSTMIKKEYYR